MSWTAATSWRTSVTLAMKKLCGSPQRQALGLRPLVPLPLLALLCTPSPLEAAQLDNKKSLSDFSCLTKFEKQNNLYVLFKHWAGFLKVIRCF